ncbi:hypothetical protein GCM10020219_077090 [Nonomuraea dietziae]
MDVDHRVEVLVGHLPQDPVAQDARVGDHHVEPAELLDRGGDQPLGHLGAADGTGGDGRPAAVAGDGSGDLGGGLGVHVVDDHGRAGGGERFGVGAAETTTRARDDGYFPERFTSRK